MKRAALTRYAAVKVPCVATGVSYAAYNVTTGEVLEAADLAALLRRVADSLTSASPSPDWFVRRTVERQPREPMTESDAASVRDWIAGADVSIGAPR